MEEKRSTKTSQQKLRRQKKMENESYKQKLREKNREYKCKSRKKYSAILQSMSETDKSIALKGIREKNRLARVKQRKLQNDHKGRKNYKKLK